jgi:L-ascorbate metabolism protein UlaG (beta-lactamase superfamily)
MRIPVASVAFAIALSSAAVAGETFEKDTIATSAGDVEITFIGHGSLMLRWEGKTTFVDPFSRLADFTEFPKADLILITHHHGDHFDLKAIGNVRTAKTAIVLTEKCAESLSGGIVMTNGDRRTVEGIAIEAVPAYNIVHTRDDGTPYHPKGEGNGYILTFGSTRIYIAGDTENTPEMKALKNIDVAFLPMNLPYTMTPEMVADAAKTFSPKVLYPYHYGETDPQRLVELLKGRKDIDVRIRRMR